MSVGEGSESVYRDTRRVLGGKGEPDSEEGKQGRLDGTVERRVW